MKKVVVHRPGSYDRLQMEEHADLVPGAGEVRIDVQAMGVNYADCLTRMGLYASAKQLAGYPITPGFEVAGHIGALGQGATQLRIGQPVFGLTLFGGYATQALLGTHGVFPIPDAMSLEEAAGFPAVYLTAWFAMFQLVHPRAGDNLLVHSAAGGVGTALTQLGKLARCRVVGVVGTSAKIEAAQNAGADVVIDKSSSDLWQEAEGACPRGYQAVFDANGVATLKQSYRHLAPTGKLVVYGFHSMLPRKGGRPSWPKLAWDYLRTPRFDPLRLTGANRSVMGFNLSFLGDHAEHLREGMLDLIGWYEEGKITTLPTTTYRFEDVARAHEAIESGQTVGKLILTV